MPFLESLRKKSRKKTPKPTFILQFHLTYKCELDCGHCYSFDGESNGELVTSDVKRVIDDFVVMLKPYNLRGRVAYTGGDPLLREDILELVDYAAIRKGLDVHILGNPHHLNRKMAVDLKKVGVSSYQQSIDGSREIHDGLRGQKGLYDDTFRAVGKLLHVGIRPTIQSTISRVNANSITEVMDECAKANVYIHAFSRLVPTGNGASMLDQILSAEEFHEFILRAIKHSREPHLRNSKTIFGLKDCLYALAFYELGEFQPDSENPLIYDGCTIGVSQLAVLSDGTVYPCRRLPIKIGKVPEQKLWDIFMNSELLNELRNPKNLEYCADCEVVKHCRGCRGVAYAVTGNYLAKDPQCWKVK